MRRCGFCKTYLEVSSFHKGSHDCKSCKNDYFAHKRELNKAAIINVIEQACTKCGLVKKADQFKKASSSKNGLYSQCKSCDREYNHKESTRARKAELSKKYRKNITLEQREKKRLYDKIRHHRKKAGMDNSFTKETWLGILDAFENCCAYCLEHESYIGKLTVEHIIPIISGGIITVDNIVPACGRCNSRKNDKPLAKFLFENKALYQILLIAGHMTDIVDDGKL
jgi:5-methylcytosine-specific restriction endonuclease McrA